MMIIMMSDEKQKFELGDEVYFIEPDKFDTIERTLNTVPSQGIIESVTIHNPLKKPGKFFYTIGKECVEVPQNDMADDEDTLLRSFFERVIKNKESDIMALKKELMKNVVGVRTVPIITDELLEDDDVF